MTTALFIDTYTRALNVSTVSVTQVPGRGLVLRFGGEVGDLPDIARQGLVIDYPVIIPSRGYAARVSYGSVAVIVQGNDLLTDHVIGTLGMPWQHRKGLAVLSNPMTVVTLPGASRIRELVTHRNSNPACAEAARIAVHLQAQVHTNSVFIAEGQRDYLRAWQLQPSSQPQDRRQEWPEEHRTDVFTNEAILRSAVKGLARQHLDVKDPAQVAEGTAFIYLNALTVDPEQVPLANFVKQLLGGQMSPLAAELATKMRSKGWKLSVDTSVANHFLQAITPEGKVAVTGWGLVHQSKEYEAEMVLLADGLTEEARVELLMKVEKQHPPERSWIRRIGA